MRSWCRRSKRQKTPHCTHSCRRFTETCTEDCGGVTRRGTLRTISFFRDRRRRRRVLHKLGLNHLTPTPNARRVSLDFCQHKRSYLSPDNRLVALLVWLSDLHSIVWTLRCDIQLIGPPPKHQCMQSLSKLLEKNTKCYSQFEVF